MINRDSPVPLYQQLAGIIRRKCATGEWEPDHKIPSVMRLMDEHELSDTTVRKAIRTLVDDGVLYVVQGLGTFVCAPA